MIDRDCSRHAQSTRETAPAGSAKPTERASIKPRPIHSLGRRPGHDHPPLQDRPDRRPPAGGHPLWLQARNLPGTGERRLVLDGAHRRRPAVPPGQPRRTPVGKAAQRCGHQPHRPTGGGSHRHGPGPYSAHSLRAGLGHGGRRGGRRRALDHGPDGSPRRHGGPGRNSGGDAVPQQPGRPGRAVGGLRRISGSPSF